MHPTNLLKKMTPLELYSCEICEMFQTEKFTRNVL